MPARPGYPGYAFAAAARQLFAEAYMAQRQWPAPGYPGAYNQFADPYAIRAWQMQQASNLLINQGVLPPMEFAAPYGPQEQVGWNPHGQRHWNPYGHQPWHPRWHHHYRRYGPVGRHMQPFGGASGEYGPRTYQANWGPGGDTTYNGASGRVDWQTKMNNVRIVAGVARQMGVDPVAAVATMLVESRGNNRAVGDRGTSFGLFQLHRGGELGNLSPWQAFDPVTNAEVALSEFRRNEGRCGSPGELAAISQRPRNRYAYARMVDAAVPEARRLLAYA